MFKIIVLITYATIGLTSGDSYGAPPADSYGAPGGQGAGSDNPNYSFDYSVNDPNTQDVKSQREQREGSQVMGEYSLREADGTTRVVRYKAGKSGFEAVVERTGEAQHPATSGRQGGGQYGPPSTGGDSYGPPSGGSGGTSNVGVTKWNNQGSDQGQGGYGYGSG